MLYFAYGSNMDWEQIKRRCPSARFVAVARLDDYRFAIARTSSRRGCGTAGVLPAPGAAVWGVVYDIEEAEFGPLDEAEDYLPGREKNGYTRREATVYAEGPQGRAHRVSLYFPTVEENPPPPSAEYKRLVISGARHWALPEDYIRELEKMAVAREADRGGGSSPGGR